MHAYDQSALLTGPAAPALDQLIYAFPSSQIKVTYAEVCSLGYV